MTALLIFIVFSLGFAIGSRVGSFGSCARWVESARTKRRLIYRGQAYYVRRV